MGRGEIKRKGSGRQRGVYYYGNVKVIRHTKIIIVFFFYLFFIVLLEQLGLQLCNPKGNAGGISISNDGGIERKHHTIISGKI